MNQKHLLNVALLIGIGGLSSNALAQPHHHEGDVVVGRSEAGQLKVEFEPEVALLEPIMGGFFNGWSGDEPGFIVLDADEPDEDFFLLEPGALIYLEVVAFDPAFKALDSGFNVLENPGDQTLLGDHLAHEHPVWIIDSDDAGFDPLQTLWNAEMRLVDLGTTGYSPSEPFTLQFTNVPEPAALTILVLGLLAGLRRR